MPAIGLVTIGQSPRDDVVPEMARLLPRDTQIIERGALDSLAPRDLSMLAPAVGDTALVTRLRTGQEVRVAEARLGPLVHNAVDEVRGRGADLVAILCTGTLPGVRWPVRVLLPGPLMHGLAAAMTAGVARLAVIVPASEQLEAARAEWAPVTDRLRVLAASPYRAPDDIGLAAETLAGWRPDLVVLDCLGFGRAAQRLVRDSVRAPVLLPRTALASAIATLL
jgi:protein AroM